MVPRSVIQRECNLSYLGDVKPVIACSFGRPSTCGSQSVFSASFLSSDIQVVNQPIPVVSVFFPELVSILKRVSSNSGIDRSNTASPVEVVSDSSGCSVKVENKCCKHKSAHKCSDTEVSAPSSASKRVTVETVDKSVKFRLKKSEDKTKNDDSDKSDSSESVTIECKSKRTQRKWLYPERYDGTTPLSLLLTNVESKCAPWWNECSTNLQ